MSESLTINTLNQGHFTHTHTPYNHMQRLGWDQVVVVVGGVREGEPQIEKGKAPFRGPGGRQTGQSFSPGPTSRAVGGRVNDSFLQAQRVGLDT